MRACASTGTLTECIFAASVLEALRHLSTPQVTSDAAGSGGDVVGTSGSGIRSPSRRKPAPVSASATAPLHQMAYGDVPSSAPPTAGPRATPAMKLSW